MARYRTKADGWFMGQYYDAGTVLELHERQAKYPVMEGQLEPLDVVHAKPKAMKKEKVGTEDNPVTPHAARIPPNKLETMSAPPVPRKVRRGERQSGRTVGGGVGFRRE